MSTVPQLNISRLCNSSGSSKESSLLLTRQNLWHNDQAQNLSEFRRCQDVRLRTVLILLLQQFFTIPQTARDGERQHYGQKASRGPIMTDYLFPLHLSLFIRCCQTNKYYLFTPSAEAMSIGSCWRRRETRLHVKGFNVGSYISHFKTSVSLWAFLLGFSIL